MPVNIPPNPKMDELVRQLDHTRNGVQALIDHFGLDFYVEYHEKIRNSDMYWFLGHVIHATEQGANLSHTLSALAYKQFQPDPID